MDFPTTQDAIRIKMGEVFQLQTEKFVLACSHCSEEFEYFTEFILHVQKHLQQLWQHHAVHTADSIDDILKNEDSISEMTLLEPIDEQSTSAEIATIVENSPIWIKSEIIDEENDIDAIYMDFWSDEQIKTEVIEQQAIDQVEINKLAIDQLPIDQRREIDHHSKLAFSDELCDARYVELLKEHQASTSNAHCLHVLNQFRRRVMPMKVTDTPETRMVANMLINSWKCSTANGVCLICEKSFTNTTVMKHHMFLHCKTPILHCPFCTKTTNELNRYRIHLRKHTNYRIECYICKIRLDNHRALESHMLSMHIEESYPRRRTKYTRPKLAKSLGNDGMTEADRYNRLIEEHNASTSNAHCLRTLNKFRRRVMPMKVTDTPETRMMANILINSWKCSTSDEVCPICEKSFFNTTVMKYHMFSHCKTPILQCPFCTKATNGLGRYRAHLRKHTNYRIECYICKTRQDNHRALQWHMNSKHKKPTAYCKECKQQFTSRRGLKNHMKCLHSTVVESQYEALPDDQPLYIRPKNPLENDGMNEADRFDRLVEEHNASTSKAHCLRVLNKLRSRVMPMQVADTPEARMVANMLFTSWKCSTSDRECPICEKSFCSTTSMKYHIFQHCKTPMLQCPYCTKTTNEMGRYRAHLRKHPNYCIEGQTGTSLDNTGSSADEVNRLNTADRYNNQLIGEQHASTSSYVEKLPQIAPTAWECYLCRKEIASYRAMKLHWLKHVQHPVLCQICGKEFIDIVRLNYHMHIHNTERTHACDLCDKTYTTRYYLMEHRRKKHNIFAVSTCRICSVTFEHLSDRAEHMRTAHGIKVEEFRCSMCDHVAATQTTLKAHTMKMHTDRFECPICHKKLRKESVGFHMRHHTEQPTLECTVCHKAFYTQISLKRHMEGHEKQPVHKCDICGHTFILHSKYQVHRRTHPEPMPFHCDVCNLGYLRAKSLQIHSIVHKRPNQEKQGT